MFDWLFPKAPAHQQVSDVAREIAERFENGPILDSGLGPLGISEMSIMYLGKRVVASWYSGVDGSPRDMSIDGKSYPARSVKGDVLYIMAAAKRRASRMIDEALSDLEARRILSAQLQPHEPESAVNEK